MLKYAMWQRKDSTVVNVPTKVPRGMKFSLFFILKQNGLAMLVNQRWNPFIVYGWNIWMDFFFLNYYFHFIVLFLYKFLYQGSN